MEKSHKPIEFHGFIRSGIGINNKGGEMETFHSPTMLPSRWRLANEDDNQVEIILVNNWLNPERETDKTWFRTHVRFHLRSGGNNMVSETQPRIREAYAQTGNVLKSAPDVKFWAGVRFYRRHDVHVVDYFYLNNSGFGGGFEDLDIGFAKLHLALIAGSTDDAVVDGNSDPNFVSPDHGRPLKGGLDMRISDLKVPGGTGIFYLWLVRNSPAGGGVVVEGRPQPTEPDATNGVAVGFFHTRGDVLGGFNKVSVNWGIGPASTFDTFRVSNVEQDAWQLRVTETLQIQPSPKISMMAAAIFEYLDNGLDESDVAATSFGKRMWMTTGLRSTYYFTKHVGLATEAAVEHIDFSAGGNERSGQLYKLSVVPTLATDTSFWGRPQIRMFATAWFWSDGIKNDFASQHADDKYAINFGVHAESWW